MVIDKVKCGWCENAGTTGWSKLNMDTLEEWTVYACPAHTEQAADWLDRMIANPEEI